MDWTHRLRLRNLKMLLSLAQTRNISHSAAMLNTTQPGLSKWLKDLEDDIGLPLFERHARGLRPTPYGDALIAHAQRIDAQLDRASGDMAALRQGGGGRVVIGASGASASDTVPLAVMHLLERMPQARVKLVESTMDRLLGQLAQGDLDVVVGRSAPEHHDPAIRSESLYLEPVHMVARPRHPVFAQTGRVSWEDLMAYRWIVWPKGTPIRNALDTALAAADQSLPADHVESNSVTINLTLINNSDMIGVASHRAALRFSQMNAMRILPLRLSGFGSVAMYWRQETYQPAAVETTLECLRQAAGERPPKPGEAASTH
jgi:DNA-binding transcriptional LysR family regulator